jgi:hypothetical protein
MRSKLSTSVPEQEEVCFDYHALGKRWGKHPKTASRIMKRHGIQPMRLTARSVLFKLSDVLRVEANAIAGWEVVK